MDRVHGYNTYRLNSTSHKTNVPRTKKPRSLQDNGKYKFLFLVILPCICGRISVQIADTLHTAPNMSACRLIDLLAVIMQRDKGVPAAIMHSIFPTLIYGVNRTDLRSGSSHKS